MRCECCNHILSDLDATAKFEESGAYVNMCKKCRGTLPPSLKVLMRSDMEDTEEFSSWEDEEDTSELDDYPFNNNEREN